MDGVGPGAFSGGLTSQNRWGGRKRNSLKQQTPLKIGGGQTKRTVHFPSPLIFISFLSVFEGVFFGLTRKNRKRTVCYLYITNSVKKLQGSVGCPGEDVIGSVVITG